RGGGDAMVVPLVERGVEIQRDAVPEGPHQTAGEEHAVRRRRGGVAGGVQRGGTGHRGGPDLLRAPPVGAAAGRVPAVPVLEHPPEELRRVLVAGTSVVTDERIPPREAAG